MLHQAYGDGDGMVIEKIKEPNQSIRMEQKNQGFMPVDFCQRWSSAATGRWIQSSRQARERRMSRCTRKIHRFLNLVQVSHLGI
jgi:hypothetical protein